MYRVPTGGLPLKVCRSATCSRPAHLVIVEFHELHDSRRLYNAYTQSLYLISYLFLTPRTVLERVRLYNSHYKPTTNGTSYATCEGNQAHTPHSSAAIFSHIHKLESESFSTPCGCDVFSVESRTPPALYTHNWDGLHTHEARRHLPTRTYLLESTHTHTHEQTHSVNTARPYKDR